MTAQGGGGGGGGVRRRKFFKVLLPGSFESSACRPSSRRAWGARPAPPPRCATPREGHGAWNSTERTSTTATCTSRGGGGTASSPAAASPPGTCWSSSTAAASNSPSTRSTRPDASTSTPRRTSVLVAIGWDKIREPPPPPPPTGSPATTSARGRALLGATRGSARQARPPPAPANSKTTRRSAGTSRGRTSCASWTSPRASAITWAGRRRAPRS